MSAGSPRSAPAEREPRDAAGGAANRIRLRAAALLFFGLMAIVHSWPLASDLGGLARLDNHDAELNTWIIAWNAHILPRDPLNLFEAPLFYPERRSLAFSEHMIVPSLIGAPWLWAGVSPVAVYNLLIILGLTLSGWAMFVVIERWTGRAWPAVIAGLLYAFNAHVLTRFVHLQAHHVEFFPFMLLGFDLVITDRRRRHIAFLAVMFVLQALCSNYLLVFSAYTLVICAMVRWRELNRDAVARLAMAGVLSAIALAPFLLPYYLVDREMGLSRSAAVVDEYVATWRDYLATGARLHFETWSRHFYNGRTALFPGFTALGLAAMALVAGRGLRDSRIRMAAALALLGFTLSLGTSVPGYAVMHEHLPLLDGLRNVSRWGWLLLAGVAILAGFGAAALEARIRRWPVCAVLLCVLVTAESIRTPVGFTPFHGIPRIYDRLAAEPAAIVAEFPFYSGASVSMNGPYVLANTRYFKPLLNGYSSFHPESFEARGRALHSFPSEPALAELRALRVTHVTVHVDRFRDRYGDKALQAIGTIPELLLVAEEDGIRLYRMH